MPFFHSCPAFPSFFIKWSCLRRCRRLLELVTSFILSGHKLRILLKEIDNRRHNPLMHNKQYTVCTHRISVRENYRLTCWVSNIYNIIRTSIMYMILVRHIAFHCSPIHFVRHIVITSFIKLHIKSTSLDCSHIAYCIHKILWISVSFSNNY